MILEAVYQLMANSPLITQLVDDRIYTTIKDDHKIGPYVVSQQISKRRPLNADLTSALKSARIQIDCYAKATIDVSAEDIAGTIIELFHGKQFIYQQLNIQLIELEAEYPDFDVDDEFSRYTLEFYFYFT